MRSRFERFLGSYPTIQWSDLQNLLRHFKNDDDLVAACEKILQGYPLEYLCGEASWGPLKLKIAPPLLIPRDETWTWLELFWKRYTKFFQKTHPLSVLDIGCGPGTLGLGLHYFLKSQMHITALDIHPLACELTKKNFLDHQVQSFSVLESNWLDVLIKTPTQHYYDLIVSNPPYCDSTALSWVENTMEDPQARFAPFGGLDPYYRIFTQARSVLKDNGMIIFEHGCDQVRPLVTLGEHFGYEYLESFWDYFPRLRASLFIKKG